MASRTSKATLSRLPARWSSGLPCHMKDVARLLLRLAGPDVAIESLNGAWWAIRYYDPSDRKTENPDGTIVDTLPWKRAQEILVGPARSVAEVLFYLQTQQSGYVYPRGQGPRPVYNSAGKWIGLTDYRGRTIGKDGRPVPGAMIVGN